MSLEKEPMMVLGDLGVGSADLEMWTNMGGAERSSSLGSSVSRMVRGSHGTSAQPPSLGSGPWISCLCLQVQV